MGFEALATTSAASRTSPVALQKLAACPSTPVRPAARFEDFDPAVGKIEVLEVASERVAIVAEAAPLVLTARVENLLHGVDDRRVSTGSALTRSPTAC